MKWAPLISGQKIFLWFPPKHPQTSSSSIEFAGDEWTSGGREILGGLPCTAPFRSTPVNFTLSWFQASLSYLCRVNPQNLSSFFFLKKIENFSVIISDLILCFVQFCGVNGGWSSSGSTRILSTHRVLAIFWPGGCLGSCMLSEF